MVQALNAGEEATLKTFLGRVSSGVEACLDAWLPKPGEGHEPEVARLWECARYSVFAGGKRLRPGLIAASALVMAQDENEAWERAMWAGAAMEMVHTYSLIQDDMPCLDDDELRRGKPTAHIAFGEATALLASDALQTGAFDLLTDSRVHPVAAVRLELVRLFARSAGGLGMVAGQMVDMAWEENPPKGLDVPRLGRMNRLKTGVNIEASCEAGAVLAGELGGMARKSLAAYGEALGRAFQVYDDVLDVIGDTATMGKAAGRDAKEGKTTFVTLLGLEGAQEHAQDEAKKAMEALVIFDQRADMLRLLARYCVNRQA